MPPKLYVAYGGLVNLEQVGDVLLYHAASETSNCKNISGRNFGRWIFLTSKNPAISYGVIRVVLPSAPSQIFHIVVERIVVEVASNHSRRAPAFEGDEYQAMHADRYCFPPKHY